MNIHAINEMQEAQRVWSEANFPDRRADHAVMGMIEELGEMCEVIDPEDESPIEYVAIMQAMIYLGRLAHIELKRAQGIRKTSTSEERRLASMDKLTTAVYHYADLMEHVPATLIALDDFEPDVRKEQDALGDLFIYMLDRANRKVWDLGYIIDDTLDSVLKRNWVADAELGQQTGEVA